MPSRYQYDAYISFAPADTHWVETEFKPRLAAAGVHIIEPDDFQLGLPELHERERAVQNSRYTILVLTPAYLASSWQEYDELLTGTFGRVTKEWRAIPLIAQAVELPPRLDMLVACNVVEDGEEAWQRLINTLSTEPAPAKQGLAALPIDQIPAIASLPAGSRMPLRPNPLFVGRKDELRSLARVLKGGERAAVGQTAAATGLGGIGKTQLATAFAHHYGQYFVGGVFWVNMADAESVRGEVAACGLNMVEMPGGLRPIRLGYAGAAGAECLAESAAAPPYL